MTTILDLGCHDGFVGLWLKNKLPDIEIDGVELHPQAVETCRRRGYRKVVQGMAEDAFEHFEPGSYDIVFAAELLEHVPDMDRLLAVCEQMIKPSGLVVISTPDGTFGNGNNPHHLRALRSIDLAELLRRRGNLHRMAVGVDTLTLAAYRPAATRGEITIHTGGNWLRWAPQDIDTKGLGGSETAAVRLADALADLGWVVTVYGDVEQGCHSQVVYRHYETYDPLAPRDVFISSRMPELFDRPVNARVKLLWQHDIDFGDRLTRERGRHIDHLLALSRFHADHLAGMYPWMESRIVQVRNGINLDHYTSGEAPKRKRRVVYTSSPDRGLDLLLEMWPQIRKRVRGATLEFAYAPVYFKIAEVDPAVRAFAARIAELADQPGVTALGSLSQPELARLLRSSMVWAHPSYHTPSSTPFMETSCIGAMEAQAAGCHVVASAWGALPETVRVGALIDERPVSESWRACFAAAIVRGLTSEETQANAQQNAPAAVAGLGWGPVAEQITDLVDPELDEAGLARMLAPTAGALG
jgi:glycosyltransferase involved in cell wall biosynthesis